jgi:dolichol kinase
MPENAISQNKFRHEIVRKMVHMCTFSIVIFIYFVEQKTAAIVLGTLLLLLFIGNTILLSSRFRILNDLNIKYFSFLLRDDEKYGYLSSNWFLLGCFLSVLLFPKYVAMLAITVLIFGDAFAALIGIRFGKHKFKNGKSLEGTLGFIFVSWLFLAIFVLLLRDIETSFIVASFIAIPIVAVVEIYSKQIKIDDNLLIPFVFGVLVIILMNVFKALQSVLIF